MTIMKAISDVLTSQVEDSYVGFLGTDTIWGLHSVLSHFVQE